MTKRGPKILSSSLVYKFYAKKVIDMRQDLLLQQLTDPRTFFAFKSYFRGVNLDEGVSNGFNLTYKCKMAISPHFLSTPQEIDLSCSIVDDTTILIEYSVKGEKLHMQEIIYLESSKSIPGKTIVYDYLIVKGKLVQCYRDAQKQAEFVFMNLQLLDEIVEGKLDLTNPNHIILSGKLPIGYNHRLDIEGMNDPRYNEVFDVKHYGFIKEKPVFESIGEPFDLNLIQRVRTGNTHGIMAQSFEKRVAGYNVGSTGGVFCTDISEIKSQEGIAVDMASILGKTLFEGKELVTLSLPIRIFQPIGLLEHTTRYWGMMPYFIKLAALEKDKVKRLKWCCSFAVSGFWNCCRQKKPFHPILGESLQAFWEDGSSIDVEYTSHIPPTCNFLVEDVDRLYRFHGRNEFKMKMNGTSMEGQNYGPNVIQFADGDKVDLYYPPGNISGLFMGDRSMCYTGSYIVRYPTADLEAYINLVPMGSCQSDNPNEIR